MRRTSRPPRNNRIPWKRSHTVLFATVNTDANLRDGPGLDATIVDFAPAGTQLTIVDRSDDEEWLQLENGFWILAALADILPAEGEQDADDDAGT